MEIIIKKAQKEDWKLVQKLNNELFIDNSVYDRYIDLSYPFSKAGVRHFQKSVSSPDFCVFLAYAGEKPVGYILGGPKKLNFRKIKTAEIIELGVSPDFRSNGIGGKLIKEFKSWCQYHGYEMIMVSSYFKNDRAIAFYKKEEFEPTDLTLEIKI